MDQAVEWLDKNAEKSVEDITAADATQADDDDETNPNVEPAALKPGEVAQSLVCNDCGKKFRSQAQAEFHASKTEHINFAESTEEIAPLTEEEKKAKLEELKRKAAERRAGTSAQDKLEQKRNEVSISMPISIRMSGAFLNPDPAGEHQKLPTAHVPNSSIEPWQRNFHLSI